MDGWLMVKLAQPAFPIFFVNGEGRWMNKNGRREREQNRMAMNERKTGRRTKLALIEM